MKFGAIRGLASFPLNADYYVSMESKYTKKITWPPWTLFFFIVYNMFVVKIMYNLVNRIIGRDLFN